MGMKMLILNKNKIEGIDKLAFAIKYGILEKKSEVKITWEKRFLL